MKKILVLAVIASLIALPAGADAAKKKKKKRKPVVHQHVEGSVALPQPYTEGCVYRAQRALMAFGADAANGVVGYTFEVDPKTYGKPFKLEVSGGGADISFYTELGDPTDPTTAPANTGYETAGPGGEKGKVPAGHPYAFVCLTEGSNVSFTYAAGGR